MPDSTDYVVIGAGTAGCIVANRLSARPEISVTLLEAGGPDTNPAIYDPSLDAMFSLWAPDAAENWGYVTTPQSNLDGRAIDIARGRVLGGSSAVNAMIYIRGNPLDFDAWAYDGCDGWDYASVLTYFKRSETYHGQPSPYHGTDGPLSVIDYANASPVSHAFVEAAAELGASARYNDFNGADQSAGAGLYQSTRTPDGGRVTAASAFLAPVSGRSNLRVVTGARVLQLLIEGQRVTGVEFATADGVQILRAAREVIVCAGAFETPKLLMLSGVGPADALRALGVPVVCDIPDVGRNLQDHMLLGVGYESLTPLPAPALLAEAGLFVRTRPGMAEASPNLQYFFGPVKFVPQEYMTDGPGFTFAPILARPHSRGDVTLASADARDNARVDPNYLSNEVDVDVLEYGIRFARELVATAPFRSFRGREIAPGDQVTDSADLRAYIRAAASTVWHPCGTCRMGADDASVVDPQLRVRGLDNLRIVDASVFPRLVNGNPNAAIMMVAEKASDLISGVIPATQPTTVFAG